MALGPLIRRCLGPFEKRAALCFRSMFVDLEALARQVRIWVPEARGMKILELGCGDGMFTEHVAKAYPGAAITGIDVTPAVGRYMRSADGRIEFRCQDIGSYASENPASIDLLIISDVMHHIPRGRRREVMVQAARAIKEGGWLVLKDWERRAGLIHLIVRAFERWVTGDRTEYLSAEEIAGLITKEMGSDCIKDSARVGPWKNNVVLLARMEGTTALKSTN